jgi:hypothetical protein
VDAAAVVEDPSGQFVVILHLHLDVDEQPLFGAIEQPNLDQLVGSQGPQLGVGRDLPKFLFQRNRCDRPIDVPGDQREGELQEGTKEAVEGFFPGAVVIDRFGHLPSFRSTVIGAFEESSIFPETRRPKGKRRPCADG